MTYLVCENCKQAIAKFVPADIRLPLTGDMFNSVFPPERGVPGPFMPGCDWLYLRCPYCPIRPIFEPDRLMVSGSVAALSPYYMNIPIEVAETPVDVDINEPDTHAYACPDCGQAYQNKKRYDMYHKTCKARV